MKGLALFFRFMTRLPVPGKEVFDSKILGQNMKWFPIVGFVIGLINFGVCTGFEYIIASPILISIIVVILDVIITGGLHLDGLADTFDGIFSYRSKHKMLEIMKDSRVGTNGVLVLILYFILKINLLVEISKYHHINIGIIMLIVPIISRIGGVINCTTEPYARTVGMGKTFVDNTNYKSLITAYLITTAIIYVICLYFNLIFMGIFLTFNIACILSFFFGRLMTKKIGGITGDTLGATLELSSLLTLFLLYLTL